MNFDIHRFVRDYRLSVASHGKYYRTGWVNLPCPFCRSANDKFHLGFPEGGGGFNCYRCGFHSVRESVAALLRVAEDEARDIIGRYNAGNRPRLRDRREDVTHASLCILPAGFGPLQARHKVYLEGRNFDPDALEQEWDLKGMGNLGPYKFRIIAPIYLDGKLVSYQGRDTTGKSELKYKACAEVNEAVHHKHTLYGIDKAQGHSVIVVEGITDVWRLGPGAVATFGSQWTKEQIPHLKRFTRRFIMFDPGEEAAQEKARQLAAALGVYGGHNEVIELDTDKDPGDLSPQDVTSLRKELFL